MSFKSEEVKAMPDKPCQPHHLSFPFRSFGKNAPVNRSFQVSWFHCFPWIHYELDQDAVYCFVCCKAMKEGKIRLTGMTEASFLVKGMPQEAYPNMKILISIKQQLLPCLPKLMSLTCSQHHLLMRKNPIVIIC